MRPQIRHRSVNSYRILITVFVLSAGLLAACSKEEEAPASTDQPAMEAQNPSFRTGTVSETMDSGGYTYIRVDDGKEEFWAAAPAFVVSVGERVTMPQGMAMTNYRSSTLDREFDVLYFVEGVQVGDAAPGQASAATLPPGHPDPTGALDDAFEIEEIEPGEGEFSVEEVILQKAELDGQTVALRAYVVKFNSAILGTNWVHVRDGSGEEGTNDLTVTTDATVNEGDRVLVKGIVRVDRDLGGGYFFPVIIENATVTVE